MSSTCQYKMGGGFVTGDGITGGKEYLIVPLLLAMMINGMIAAGPVYKQNGIKFSYPGASAISTDRISENELNDAKKMGRRIAKLTQMLKRKN